jgi:hypothetical protein
MAKYSMYSQQPQENPAKRPVHPVWRGIGCGLMIIIPIISYVAADFLVTNASTFKWMIIPGEMIIRDFKDPLILVRIFYALILIVALYLILTIVTFVINRFFGPSRYGPYDIPLDKVNTKK